MSLSFPTVQRTIRLGPLIHARRGSKPSTAKNGIRYLSSNSALRTPPFSGLSLAIQIRLKQNLGRHLVDLLRALAE